MKKFWCLFSIHFAICNSFSFNEPNTHCISQYFLSVAFSLTTNFSLLRMGDKNPSSVKSYDDVLDYIGQFGPWQVRIFFYLWLTSAAGGLAVVVYTFTAFSTPYQCEISQCQTKYNGSHWITLDQGKAIPTPPGQCQYYGIANSRPSKDLTCDDYVSAISDKNVDRINETCGGESLVFDKTYVTSSLSK